MSLADIFLQNYPPNEQGWTEIGFIQDLILLDPKFQTNNGCQWARKGSSLDKKYNIKRFQAKELGGKGNRVVAVQLQGFKENPENHIIPQNIKKFYKNQPCVVCGVISSDMELDHKDARYQTSNYTINDFQPMTKANNDAKREHCKKCLATNCRFDATLLGFSKSYIEGDKNSPFCKGCFWYDPKAFRQQVMKGV